MSDIRFNQWLHNSGTGGVSQVDGGHVGIGTTNPLVPVGAGNTQILNVGVVTANTFYGDGSNLSGIQVGGASSLSFNDNIGAYFGNSQDLKIYHDGFHSYTGSAYLSGCIVCRYNNDAVSRDISLQKANSGMNLQLVTGTISGVSGDYLAIKKNGGGTGVCYINGFFGGNIEAHGGIREISSGNWTTTTVHGSGITGSNDSASS